MDVGEWNSATDINRLIVCVFRTVFTLGDILLIFNISSGPASAARSATHLRRLLRAEADQAPRGQRNSDVCANTCRSRKPVRNKARLHSPPEPQKGVYQFALGCLERRNELFSFICIRLVCIIASEFEGCLSK